MAFYQAFKTKDRDQYCSSTKFRNHDEGKEWITECLAHFGIQASQILSTSTPESQPDRATIWP